MGAAVLMTVAVTPAMAVPAAPSPDATIPVRISLWHDLDSDGEFTERYEILDTCGVSGPVSPTARPFFDDIAITIPGYGADVTPEMIYPSED